MQVLIQKPAWLKKSISAIKGVSRIRNQLESLNLNTVCREALCPNLSDCWSRYEITLLILGRDCTRRCKFCNISSQSPLPPDPTEPERIALFVKDCGLDYVVITSVTRDDIPDYGCEYFLRTIREIKNTKPDTNIEILIPDFMGNRHLLDEIAISGCEVVGHNTETVPRIYPYLRDQADYERSLEILYYLKRRSEKIVTKSSIMLGLGEREEEVLSSIKDLKSVGVDILCTGQYLSPSDRHFPVAKYYTLQEFGYFKSIAEDSGFLEVRCSPFARSSFKARESYERFLLKRDEV